MHQAVHARLQLDERAEGTDAHHVALQDGAHGVLFFDVVPGLGLQLLIAQLDAFPFPIQGQDFHFHFLVDAQHFAGMAHPAPGQVGDVDQAVHAAKIDERAEIGKAAHDARHRGAFFQAFPGGGLLGGAFFRQHLLAAGHDALLLLIHVDDLELHVLAHELVDLFHIAGGQLRRGHESADAAVHQGKQAALDGLLAYGVHILVVFILFHQRVPHLAVDDIALREQDVAFAVVDLDDLDLDFVAELNVLFHHVGALDQSVGFITDVDAHFVIGDLHHRAGDGLARADANHCLFNVLHGQGLVIRAFLLNGGIGDGFLGFLVDVFHVVHACDNLLK